jgi:hypothetical protein
MGQSQKAGEASGDANYEYSYNWLEKVRGFLCNLSMTFEMMVPFLKGFHLTLAKHNTGRADDGWKLTNREWEAWLGHAVETGRMTKEETAAARHPETEEGKKPPLSEFLPLGRISSRDRCTDSRGPDSTLRIC